MANELPDHQEIERVMDTEPKKLLESFPDGFQKERARDHLGRAYDYVKELREKSKADRHQ